MSAYIGKHLSLEKREVIEEGLRDGYTCRKIAARIGVAPSTVSREVKANRTVKENKTRGTANVSVRCIHYKDCDKVGTACKKCSTKMMSCRLCKTRHCIDVCSDFKRTQCRITERWPYICPPNCKKRTNCNYPKYSYKAYEADAGYRSRLSSSRSGISITEEQLQAMNDLVVPLIRQGQSLAAIWCGHEDELPVGVRCAYNYHDAGYIDCPALEFPRKVRIRPRKKPKTFGRERIDRTGRLYSDFLALPLNDQVRVVQGDSVCGFEDNVQDLFSLHIVFASFQFYLIKDHADPEGVVGWLDAIETILGCPEAFEAIFGILLVDRGCEFDDFEGMERSCLVEGVRRCRVFYCDAMRSDQKAAAERNHEQLRRILPKKRSDFDALTRIDAAVLTSHVNSYPNALKGGRCPFDLVGPLVPQKLFDELGISRVEADGVILKPYLMPHAVAQ